MLKIRKIGLFVIYDAFWVCFAGNHIYDDKFMKKVKKVFWPYLERLWMFETLFGLFVIKAYSKVEKELKI